MRRFLLTVGLALSTGFGTPLSAAHPHYLGLLREGSIALERGSLDEAVRTLRLACFGLLEEPPLLAPCLVQLGVAQASTGEGPGFRETFQRLSELEERFDAYTQAEIGTELREAYEAAIRVHIPLSSLETSQAFRHLGEPADQASPSGDALALDREPYDAGGAPPQEPTVAPAPAPALNAADLEALARARQLLAAARTRQDLEEPFRLAREVADANPASRTAQHLAAEIAYRGARWEEAVSYFRRGGDPADGNPMLLFYMAVSLYEAGETEAAAEALQRSLPRIEHTPLVRSYRSKILGDGSGNPR